MKAVLKLLVVVAVMSFGQAFAAEPATFPIDQVLGDKNAPVTIIEFSSLTCPHCAHFDQEVMPRIKADWIDTGKAKFIFRDFPTAPAGLSYAASMIAHCAGSDRYFGVLSLLFRTQEKWISAEQPLDEIKRVVRVAGISPDQVDACLKREDLFKALQQRAEDGSKTYGIDGTPSLVINGTVHRGASSYDDVKKNLEAAYQKAVK